jgi:hypothetical protein
LDAGNAEELDATLRAMPRSRGDGLLVSNDLFLLVNKAKMIRAGGKAKLPAVFPFKEYHDDGPLMSYGPSARGGAR